MRRTDIPAGGEPAPRGVAKPGARLTPARLLCAAAIFHAGLAVALYEVGRHRLLPATFDANGAAVSFAPDSARYRDEAAALVETFKTGGLRRWLGADFQPHIKLYSVCFLLFGRRLGLNVVAAEPLNLLCYLASLALVFNLAREVFDRRAGLVAAAAFALWPSLLLHTTQLVKDTLFVALALALALLVVRWLTRDCSWSGALLSAGAGAALVTALWFVRADMGELVVATVLLGAAMIVARRLGGRRARAANLSAALVVVAVALAVPFVAPRALKLGAYHSPQEISIRLAGGQTGGGGNADAAVATAGDARPPWSRAAARVGEVRRRFVEYYPDTGSNLDADVRIEGLADLLRYLPRAAGVGFFAPFPAMWLAPGKLVGSFGRHAAGVESLAMYAVEALALAGLWRARRNVAAWFLFASAAAGVTALGLVVVNVGTLYRLRYFFLVPLVALAAGGVSRIAGRLAGETRGIGGAAR